MSTDTMLPILRQMHEADPRGQAALLLMMPQAVILKHAEPLKAACRRSGLDAGIIYVDLWVAAMLATRTATGSWRFEIYQPLKTVSADLANFAAAAAPPSIEI